MIIQLARLESGWKVIHEYKNVRDVLNNTSYTEEDINKVEVKNNNLFIEI